VPGANSLWNCWAHDRNTLELYRQRCRQQAEEMTCAAQAAEILAERAQPGETLLDAGCGGAYYLHALQRRQVPVHYHGLDFTPQMVDLAHAELCPAANLDRGRVWLSAIEDLDQPFDNILCFNVLTNNPHYGLPLWRLLKNARRRLLLRESLGEVLITRFTPDPYLDEGQRHIRVYHNTYPLDEVTAFMQQEGFVVTRIRDRRTNDGVESVVDIPHTWRILLAERG
jgi:SAM-dependent methyltransferase